MGEYTGYKKPMEIADYMRVSELVDELLKFQESYGDVKVGVGGNGVVRVSHGGVGISSMPINGCVIEIA